MALWKTEHAWKLKGRLKVQMRLEDEDTTAAAKKKKKREKTS